MFRSRLRREDPCQEPTPTAVCLIPAIIVNAMLDGDAVSVDTLMAIPCHVMQGKISSRTDVAGFRFSIFALAVYMLDMLYMLDKLYMLYMLDVLWLVLSS